MDLFDQKVPETDDNVLEVFMFWQKTMGYERRRYTIARRKKIKARLKIFSKEQLFAVIRVVAADPWWRGANDRDTAYDDIMNIFRNDERVEQLLDKAILKDDLLPEDLGDLF